MVVFVTPLWSGGLFPGLLSWEKGAGKLPQKVINCPCGRKRPQTLLFLSGGGTKAQSHKGMGRGREFPMVPCCCGKFAPSP